jgi:hypothetical protein
MKETYELVINFKCAQLVITALPHIYEIQSWKIW